MCETASPLDIELPTRRLKELPRHFRCDDFGIWCESDTLDEFEKEANEFGGQPSCLSERAYRAFCKKIETGESVSPELEIAVRMLGLIRSFAACALQFHAMLGYSVYICLGDQIIRLHIGPTQPAGYRKLL